MGDSKNIVVGRHYPEIDGLRAIACLLVVWFHSSIFADYANPIPSDAFGTVIYHIVSHIGQSGVDLFFVISGFLITGILVDSQNNRHPLRKFYIRRSLRIFPLYYAFLCILALLLILSGQFDLSGLSQILPYFLYVQNFMGASDPNVSMYVIHFWSLAIEEQFYLFWPIVLYAFYKPKNLFSILLLCAVLIGLSWYLRVYFCAQDACTFGYYASFSHMEGLLLGAGLAILDKHHKDWLIKNRNMFAGAAMLCACLVIAILFSSADVHYVHKSLMQYGFVLSAFFYCVILAILITGNDKTLVRSFLNSPILARIGKVSYGLYVLHLPLMSLVAFKLKLVSGYWSLHLLLFIGVGALSFVVSLLVFKFFEKPFLVLKDKYAPYEK